MLPPNVKHCNSESLSIAVNSINKVPYKTINFSLGYNSAEFQLEFCTKLHEIVLATQTNNIVSDSVS